jgi:hypothetical protein
MHSISGVDYCYTKKFTCLSITREILLDIDAPSGRNNPSVTRRRSLEGRGLQHGNIARPTSTTTQSRHGEEIAQPAAVRMSIWWRISKGAMREGNFDEDSVPKLYTQHGVAGTREAGAGSTARAQKIP